MNPLVTSIDKLDFNTAANIEGEWFINEEINLAYFSTFASNLYRQTLVLTWIMTERGEIAHKKCMFLN